MNKKIRSLGLILVILLTPALMPAWSSESAAGTLDGGTGATERIALDSVPIPLPHDCDGVTPPGESPPACCAYGYVYYDGVPVSGASVHIESAYGDLNATTASGGASGEPYYAADLSAAPLLVSSGDVVTFTATYEGSSASTVYEVAPDGQQVDVVMVILVNPLFGDGGDGDLTVTGSLTNLNPVRASASGTAGSNLLTTSNVIGGGFQQDQVVMIHQARGTDAGKWELSQVQSVASGQLALKAPLSNSYVTDAGASRAQVVWVPQYGNVTVDAGATVSPADWDGHVGGILAFLAHGTVIVNGSISANGGNGLDDPGNDQLALGGVGAGFSGGQSEAGYGQVARQGDGTGGQGGHSTYSNGNGGGGGYENEAESRAGGGGGGNGTAGGDGQQRGDKPPYGTPGTGGHAVGSADLTTMAFGGGGGGSAEATPNNGGGGGAGGGLVVISGAELVVSGAIHSNGGNGGNGQPGSCGIRAGGGGGAGGSILIKSQASTVGTSRVTATGGSGGGDSGALGGKGGNGRIRIEYCESLSGTTNPSASTQQKECRTGPIVTIHTIYPHPATQGQDIVTFRGSAVDNDEDGASITQYVWRSDLDGILSTQAEFAKPASELSVGTHTIYFKARDDEGEWSEEISSILAINQAVAPPAAEFAADVLSGTVPLTVTFTSQSTGDITFYQWDFGDGATSPQQNPVHVYESSGTFAVSLTVTGPGGSDTETKAGYITATSETPESPLAEFTADVTSGTAPLTVQFTNQSTGDISSYSWDFGDGGTSTQQNPAHAYDSAGAFTVSLTATGPGGSDTETKVDYITALSDVEASWTFLLYLAGDNNLHRFLDDALHRLEENINPNVNVLVLTDGAGNNNTWRYDVQSGGDYTDNVNRWYMGELGMDDPQTLTNFVDWARQDYSATHTYLAIADHGLGTGGTAWDDTSGTHAHITVAELRTALQEATLDGADPLDVVHYDSCLMAMIENAYQIKEYASYLVASENLGWGIFAYDEYLDGVTESTTPRDLAVEVADKYHNHGRLSGYPRTISTLDLSRAGTVKDAVSSLAAALQGSLEENKYYISNTRDATQKFDSQDYHRITLEDEYLDLYHLAQLIKQNVPDDTVKDAAQGVMDAIGVVGEGFVVAEHHESGAYHGTYLDLDNAHGVAIYYPPASGGYHYSDYLGHVFRFTADSEWDEFLLAYFGAMGLPPLPGEDPGVPPVLEPGRKVYLPAVSRN